jgi:hypothetical protein
MSMRTGRMTKRLSITLAATAVLGLLATPATSYAHPGAATAGNALTDTGRPCRLHPTQIRHVERVGDQYTYPRGGKWQVEGRGGTTLSLTFTTSIANSVSATLGASVESINDSVGFNVTKTRTVAISGSWKAPNDNGKYVLYAGYIDYVTQFEVWQKWSTIDGSGICAAEHAKWKKAGTEYAYEYAGYDFDHYQKS